MTTVPDLGMRHLLAGLPPLEPGTELILRPENGQPIAVLRPEGRAPQVFALRDGLPLELAAADDVQLPGHRLLGDPRLLAATLRPWLGEVVQQSLVAWRPRRRAVLRLATADGRVHWLKLLDHKTWRRASRTLTMLPPLPAPARLAAPTALLDEHAAYLASSAPGTSLRTRLAAGEAPPFDLLRRTLRTLAAATATDLPNSDFASARKAAVDMLGKGQHLHRNLVDLVAVVAAIVAPTPAAAGIVHGDLHDKQIFVGDDVATLIDLEGITTGDPTFDVVNLAEHVRLRDLQQHGRDDGRADELLRHVSDRSPDELLPWRLLVRARLCGVYALRPRWTGLTELLRLEVLTLAEACR